ncbi:hypothetical protein ACJX0J_038187, partial [Zea mays]
ASAFGGKEGMRISDSRTEFVTFCLGLYMQRPLHHHSPYTRTKKIVLLLYMFCKTRLVRTSGSETGNLLNGGSIILPWYHQLLGLGDHIEATMFNKFGYIAISLQDLDGILDLNNAIETLKVTYRFHFRLIYTQNELARETCLKHGSKHICPKGSEMRTNFRNLNLLLDLHEG